jgi:hypothetical protein
MIAFAGAIKADASSCNLFELYVMDVASNAVRQLTDIPGPRIGYEPDGRVAYGEDKCRRCGLDEMKALHRIGPQPRSRIGFAQRRVARK